MYSNLIKNATVVDGTGRKAVVADVAIENDKIVAVNTNITTAAKETHDATGLILAPGFIDVQNHSDSYWQLFDNPNLHSLVSQGYTSILVGNSGTSLAPLISEHSLLSVQKWLPTTGLNVNWRSFAEYRDQLKQIRFGCNISSLIGYSTIRRGLLGDSIASPTESELASLLQLIEDGLKTGASGVSVGLQYSHELNVTEVELIALAKLCAKYDKLLAVGLRNETDAVVDSVRELASIAEHTKVKLKISHLKIRYKQYWPQLKALLDTIESSWHRGAQIYFDCYPYTFTWQPLYTYLPKWSLEGGRTHLLERLNDYDQRSKILSELKNHPAKIGELIIASTATGLKVNGKKISDVAKEMSTTSEQAVINLIKSGGVSTLVFDDCLDPETMNIMLNHSLALIATNGGGFNLEHTNRLVHPRSFGTAPLYLRRIYDSKDISIEEGIAKLTSRPAKLLNITDRGLIKAGYFADLVLFDPKTINSKASLSNPYQYPIGIQSVWVNGLLATLNGVPTGQLGGQFLN